MEPATIIAGIGALLAVLGGGAVLGKRVWSKWKKKSADNEGFMDHLMDIKDIAIEEQDEIKALISQFIVASKAIDKQKSAVERIDENKALRDTLFKAAMEIGPEAVDELEEALTPVPKDFKVFGGAHLDKLTKIKKAQREELSDKEAMNEILANSGKMAKELIKAAKAFAKLQK